MTDYEDRRHPINKLCPKCLSRFPMRESQLMYQHIGGDDYRITCSDFSVCNYFETVKGEIINGIWVCRSEDGSGGWEDEK